MMVTQQRQGLGGSRVREIKIFQMAYNEYRITKGMLRKGG